MNNNIYYTTNNGAFYSSNYLDYKSDQENTTNTTQTTTVNTKSNIANNSNNQMPIITTSTNSLKHRIKHRVKHQAPALPSIKVTTSSSNDLNNNNNTIVNINFNSNGVSLKRGCDDVDRDGDEDDYDQNENNIVTTTTTTLNTNNLLSCKSPAKKPKFVVTYKEMREFFTLLNEESIREFLKRDSCCLISDKYALAMVFTYFKRAKFYLNEYNRLNFYLALYLASDIEEDVDEYKYEIFPWALGARWRQKFSKFLRQRDGLLRRIGYRAIVSRKCCEEVMSLVPDHGIWQLNPILIRQNGEG